MKNNKVTEDIIYIGVDDADIDLFEGQYNVPKGISYNSYLIKDEKVVLMDTVDFRKSEQWLKNLEIALEGQAIDYLVISHLEPDHSSNIGTIIKKYPDVTLVGNSKTFDMLPQFCEISKNTKKLIVKEGETLNIGKHTLQFFMAPMVHWPEVMVTYDMQDKIVFSADGFGKFGTLELTNDNELFNISEETWTDEARRYYINIVGKYGIQVQALLKKLSTLSVDVICPLHGPILKDNIGFFINKYDIWSSYKPEEKGVLIAYASIYGNTAKAAHDIKTMIENSGEQNITIMDLARQDIHEAVSQAFKYDRMILLASSYNMSIFPPMENFIRILKSKNYQNRKIGIVENGSWAPSAARCMIEIMKDMKNVTIIEPVITIKTTINEENKKEMKELANKIV